MHFSILFCILFRIFFYQQFDQNAIIYIFAEYKINESFHNIKLLKINCFYVCFIKLLIDTFNLFLEYEWKFFVIQNLPITFLFFRFLLHINAWF